MGVSFGQLVRHLAASSSIYTAGTIGLRFASFLLIPLYWRFLDPADYGVLAVTDIFKTFLSIVLGLGLADGVTRFYHAWPVHERPAHLGSIWMLDWGTSFLFGLPVVLWGAPLGRIFQQVPFDPYLRLSALTAICLSLGNTPLATLRIQENARSYVSCTAVSFLLFTGSSIYFVVYQRLNALGVLYAQLVSAVGMVSVYMIIMLRRARPGFHAAHVRTAVKYSLPLLPSGFIEAVISTTDRFLLEKRISLTDLGLYSSGDTMASLVRLIGQSLKTSWIPFAMRTVNERRDAATIIGRMATFVAVAITFSALAVAALSRDAITLIGVAKYQPVAGLVPLFVIPYLILSGGMVFAGGYYFASKTQYAPLITAAHLVASLTANLILIPIYGLYGAILANSLGWFTRVALSFVISQRVYPIPFEWLKLITLLVGALATFALSALLPIPPSLGGFAARSIVLFIYSSLVIWFTLEGRVWIVNLIQKRKRPRASKGII